MGERFWDNVDDGLVGGVGGCREEAGGFVEEEDAAGVGLEDFPGGGDVVKFSDFKGAVCFGKAVEEDLAGI